MTTPAAAAPEAPARIDPAMRPPEHRVDQQCHKCGQFDRHPRHIHAGGEEEDYRVQVKHMDCCSSDGCPDGSCNTALQESGGLHGDQLAVWLRTEANHPLAPAARAAAVAAAPAGEAVQP